MNPLIPSHEVIPAPWWLMEGLGQFTFLLHLLLMNVALGGTLLAAVGYLRGKPEQSMGISPAETVRTTPTLIALTVNMGVAPLLFVQVNYGHIIYASSVLMAVFWLAVPLVLILAYYGAYIVKFNMERSRLVQMMLVLTSAMLLFVAFAFVNNMTLMLRPGNWHAYFEQRSGTLLNLGDPILWPRLLHFITASVAVSGLFVAVKARFLAWRGKVQSPEKAARGLRLFAIATLAQAAVGLWFLLALPAEIRNQFLGEDLLRTVLLGLGIMTGLGAAVFAFRGNFWPSLSSLLGTMVLMVTLRALLRNSFMQGIFEVSSLEMRLQLSPMLLFFITFLLGLGILAWMIRSVLLLRGGES